MERTEREAEDAEDDEDAEDVGDAGDAGDTGDAGCSRKTKAERCSPACEGHRRCAGTLPHTNTDVQAQLLIVEQHLFVW